MKYLREFVIGSSALVFLPFFYTTYKSTAKNYKYKTLTIGWPLLVGLYNVLSLIIAESFGLSNRLRFFIITIIGYITALLFVHLNNLYDFTEKEWKKYYIKLFIGHFIIWNVVIYNIEKYII